MVRILGDLEFYDKQAEGEGLRLELANLKSKWASSEAGLRQRLAVVYMELEAVRREKEEYQKGHVLNQLETVALGNQVSALKLDIASRREPIVCEQSEVVGQLREENLALRRQLVSLGGLKYGPGGPKPPARDKLKQAARDIARLTRDKQQLIAIGNRLRAQLQTSELEGTLLHSHQHTSSNIWNRCHNLKRIVPVFPIWLMTGRKMVLSVAG
ncbi:hypothetical protein N1851_005916 [Merluccius polli]|uniref:Uncharacterized protein n=1 Tax=Merluccius polli TaxID=89951 RepID=A0AA47N6M5_MERPO|nr:hypothetical protein N1851_005916 [Merluccius polli]